MSMPALPASRALRIGLALFVLGLVAIAIDVLPFFAGDENRPVWLNAACMLAPIGFGVVVWAVVRAGRATQRRALEQLELR